jgi:hypothetical protein
MVGSNGAPYGGTALLHSLDRSASGCVLQYDAELGEGSMNLEQMGNKLDLGIEDVDVLCENEASYALFCNSYIPLQDLRGLHRED